MVGFIIRPSHSLHNSDLLHAVGFNIYVYLSLFPADVTSIPPPWSISIPLEQSEDGKPLPLSFKGPFEPGEALVLDAVFYALKHSGASHVLSQSRNISYVASTPPTNTGDDSKESKYSKTFIFLTYHLPFLSSG